MQEFKEFIRDNEEYPKLVNKYGTENVELMGEKFLQTNDDYYSLSNRKQIMEYPYLKMGEL